MADSIIYHKEKTTVSFKICVPKKHAGNFIVSFGDTFSNTEIGHSYPIVQVDKYERLKSDVKSPWCIYVTVPQEQEEEFKNFLKSFSKENNCDLSTF